MATHNHYEILGVTPTAGAETIRAVYRSLAKSAHPDAGGNGALFALIAEAHRVLSDPVLRAAYDRELASGTAQAGPSAPGPGAPRRAAPASRWDDATDPDGSRREMEASARESEAIAASYDGRSDAVSRQRGAQARHLARQYHDLLDQAWWRLTQAAAPDQPAGAALWARSEPARRWALAHPRHVAVAAVALMALWYTGTFSLVLGWIVIGLAVRAALQHYHCPATRRPRKGGHGLPDRRR